MRESELRKILREGKVPEPDEAARLHTISVAMATFESDGKNRKGSSADMRLKGNTTHEPLDKRRNQMMSKLILY